MPEARLRKARESYGDDTTNGPCLHTGRRVYDPLNSVMFCRDCRGWLCDLDGKWRYGPVRFDINGHAAEAQQRDFSDAR